MILINTFLPVDVIRAGTYVSIHDMNLSGFKRRKNNQNQLYQIIDSYNDTLITLDYNIEFEYFSVKVSLAKLLFGTNAINLPFNCGEELIELVNFHLAEAGLPFDFSEFNVSLIEVSHNYICETTEDKEKYIKYFSKKDVSRKTKHNYKTSVVYKNKTSRTTIYDKKEEIGNNNDIPVSKSVLDRTLRVEHKLLKKGVKKYFKDRTVKNILLSGKLEEIFLSENKSAGLHLKALHKSLFYKILMCNLENKRTSYKKRVLKFYQELNQLGEQYVKERYSTHQIKTYKKIMTSSGYNTTYISKSVNPVDFMNLEEKKTVRTNKEERKMIMEKVKKEKKTFVVKVKEFLSLCLPCNFFRKVFGWFDTS